MNNPKFEQAVKSFRQAVEAEGVRQGMKKKSLDRLAELQRKEAEQRDIFASVEKETVVIAGRCALGDYPERELDSAVSRRRDAADALASTQMMIKCIEQDLPKLEPDPRKDPPLEEARSSFFKEVFEITRAELLSTLPQLHFAFVARCMATGILNPTSDIDWHLFLRTL